MIFEALSKTEFPEEESNDPFASILKNKPAIIDPNLKIEKGMDAKSKWKTGR